MLLAAAVVAAIQPPTVHMKDFAFTPAAVHVRAGETVTFVNDDSEAHTVRAADGSFDSAGMETGQRWTHRFRTPGTYAYFCELHPYMRAVIIVAPAAQRKAP